EVTIAQAVEMYITEYIVTDIQILDSAGVRDQLKLSAASISPAYREHVPCNNQLIFVLRIASARYGAAYFTAYPINCGLVHGAVLHQANFILQHAEIAAFGGTVEYTIQCAPH